MTIGMVSARTGVGIETIRYYERKGLLSPPQRSHGRHRLFGEDDVKLLSFIRRGRELGFSLLPSFGKVREPFRGCRVVGEGVLLAMAPRGS